LAYAETLLPAAVMQIGCFTASECRFLVAQGCPSRLVGTDFDAARLDYLRARFAGGANERIELRQLDLETATPADFAGIGLVVCTPLLSNTQPEGLDRLFAALAASDVSCLLASDVYVAESLLPSARHSVPGREDRNWFHPYIAVARSHGL